MDGDGITRWTVRLALLLYALTLALHLAFPSYRRTARLLWTTGCILFLAHVAAAFHYFHGWSHGHAYSETARQTAELTGVRSGAGLYLNYLFTSAWVADVAWWWLDAEAYGRRPRGITLPLHCFMFFIAFTGTVVFERGATRWVAVALTALLGALWLRRWVSER